MSIEVDPTERVVILRTDLEEWETVLRWAYGHFAALDLSENYRAGRPNLNKPAKLTTLTARVHDKIEGYLDDGVSTDELLQSK